VSGVLHPGARGHNALLPNATHPSGGAQRGGAPRSQRLRRESPVAALRAARVRRHAAARREAKPRAERTHAAQVSGKRALKRSEEGSACV
jgi:hypothetical protein